MRRIVCDECGKPYDYDRDEFCPKCGAFIYINSAIHGIIQEISMVTAMKINSALMIPIESFFCF